MTWLDLYNYLYERANDIKNPGSFPWQEEVKVWDWETLDYYSADLINANQIKPDCKISFSVDTYQREDN